MASRKRTAVLMGGILLLAIILSLMVGSPVLGIDHRFDQGSGIGGDSDPRWHALNDYETGNNHYMAQYSDMYLSYISAEGNAIAAWVDGVNDNWTSTTGSQRAQEIMNTLSANFATVPTWVILNEISASQWPNNVSYREFICNVVYYLKNTHGRSVIICAPFQNPANNDWHWNYLATHGWIGMECYLSGAEIRDGGSGYSVSWCQTQYQNSKNSYLNRIAPADGFRLCLVEHFAHTTTGTGWGRGGLVYAADWVKAIDTRCKGSDNVGIWMFCSYYWQGNPMGAAEWAQVDAIEEYGASPCH